MTHAAADVANRENSVSVAYSGEGLARRGVTPGDVLKVAAGMTAVCAAQRGGGAAAAAAAAQDQLVPTPSHRRFGPLPFPPSGLAVVSGQCSLLSSIFNPTSSSILLASRPTRMRFLLRTVPRPSSVSTAHTATRTLRAFVAPMGSALLPSSPAAADLHGPRVLSQSSRYHSRETSWEVSM